VPDEQITVTGGKSALTLNRGEDYVVFSQLIQEEVKVENAEFVFCGFGIVAPEYGWNDYEGIDMTGKIAVVMVNDPGFYLKDENMFTGNAMTYYGRWTYKYEEAARQGAAGVIIVHEDDAAGYPWEVVTGSWSGPQFDLAGTSDEYRLPLRAWVTRDAANRLFEAGGLSFEDAKRMALEPDFKPVPLQQTVSITLNNTIEEITSHNILARLPGATRPNEKIGRAHV